MKTKFSSDFQVAVEKQDIFPLLLYVLKYSLGGMSYIVYDAISFVKKYHKSLTSNQLRDLASEVREAIQEADRTKTTVGLDFDQKMWTNFLDWCKDKIGD